MSLNVIERKAKPKLKLQSEVFNSMMLKVMTDEGLKEYHRMKLYELSLKSIGDIPQLSKPTYEQKRWVLFRLKHSNTWTKVHENKIVDWRSWK